MQRGDWSAARSACDSAYEYAVGGAEIEDCQERARLGLRRAEEEDEAAAEAQRAEALRTELANLLEQARLAHRARNLGAALALYERIDTLASANPEASAGRENVLLDQNRAQRFVRQTQQAEADGRLDEAVTLMEGAAELDASAVDELTRLRDAQAIMNRRGQPG